MFNFSKTESEIETGLLQIDPEQAAQIAHWKDPHWSLIDDLRALENIKLIRLLGIGVGGPLLVYVINRIAQDLLNK